MCLLKITQQMMRSAIWVRPLCSIQGIWNAEKTGGQRFVCVLMCVHVCFSLNSLGPLKHHADLKELAVLHILQFVPCPSLVFLILWNKNSPNPEKLAQSSSVTTKQVACQCLSNCYKYHSFQGFLLLSAASEVKACLGLGDGNYS